MTRRKSGLPSDDSTTEGLTSLCNSSDTADATRQRALQIEQKLKLAKHYDTVTPTDLASWPAESDVHYTTLPNSLKSHVKDYYTWGQLRNTDPTSSVCDLAAIHLGFDQLDDSVHDSLATELREIHTIILYTLHTQVIPEYTAYHTLGGQQTVHWESIAPDSDQHHRRQLVLDRMLAIQAASRVPGAQGRLLDYYGWSKDLDDIGIVHLLYRDLPDSKHIEESR
jgi:hypothetical protein